MSKKSLNEDNLESFKEWLNKRGYTLKSSKTNKLVTVPKIGADPIIVDSEFNISSNGSKLLKQFFRDSKQKSYINKKAS